MVITLFERGKARVPSFTKKAIMDSFLHLLEKKPLDKITVRDIVDDCGINRNTFYYYFQDIYAVLEEYCDLLIKKLPQNGEIFDTVSALYQILEGFATAHRRAAKTLAFSLGFEGLDRYFGERFEPVMSTLISQKYGFCPSALFLRFLRHGLIGLGLCMLRGEQLSDDIEGELSHLLSLPPRQNQTICEN